MKHPIFAVATTATFVAGVIVGHYAMPTPVKPARNAANEISTRSSEGTPPTLCRLDIGRPSNAQQIANLGERSLLALLSLGES
jgi:hypothetical protein